jgi:phosphomevalonate kinase
MKIYVPGNLLLLGEYSITIPGGKGIATAVDTWVEIESELSDKLSVSCDFRKELYCWSEGSFLPDKLKLIGSVFNGVSGHLKAPIPFPLTISINSSHFYYADGRKKGYGSSAAVTVGLTFLLLYYAYSRIPDLATEVFPLSLAIHREYQDGRGSGYDIAASLFGGAGLFTGGVLPTWLPISAPWMELLYIIRGDEETSTKNALVHFNNFKECFPDQISKFLCDSNQTVEKITACQDVQSAKKIFKKGSALNRWIHEKIGIPSEGPMLKRFLQECRTKGCPGKPLGAGSEVAAVFLPKNHNFQETSNSKIQPLTISSGGLRWEL